MARMPDAPSTITWRASAAVLSGPRVGDRLANPVLRYSQRLHLLNLIALVLGRLKLWLPAASLLAHFGSRYVANIKISVT